MNGDIGAGTPAATDRPREDSDYVFHELTRSICPGCRKVIDAKILLRDDKVYMSKRCPDCGPFTAVNARLKLRENHRFEFAAAMMAGAFDGTIRTRTHWRARTDPAVDLLVANGGRVTDPCQDRSRRRRGPKASLYKGLSPGHARSPRATIECARAGTRRGGRGSVDFRQWRCGRGSMVRRR